MRHYNYGGGGYHRPSFFGGGFGFFPPVIKTLLIANIAIFLVMLLLGNFRIGNVPLYNYIIYYFALMPLGQGFIPWQLFTYLFLHGGIWHVFLNMFILWMFGMELEHMWGSRKFLFFYLLCGVGAGLIHLFISPLFTEISRPTIGASGAVYGILIAFAMMFPDRIVYIWLLFPVRVKYLAAFLIIIGVVSGISGTADGIAHFAHLGGALIAFLYIQAERDRIPLRRWFANFKHRRSSDLRYHRGNADIRNAKYYEVKNDKSNQKSEDIIDQERIDQILDKIGKSGYENLTEEEKRILFEASKKLK